jgi:hypothetical protein
MAARSLDFVRPRPSAANLLSDPFSNAFVTYLSHALSISCGRPGRAGPFRRPRAESDGDRGGNLVTEPKLSVSLRFGFRVSHVSSCRFFSSSLLSLPLNCQFHKPEEKR